MLLDAQKETLSIAAQRGIDPAVAGKVKVRLGQGIAGWVAHNRKPLFVRVRDDADPPLHTDQDAYNSDSFICVPLTYNDRVCGVLNLSNKRDGEVFDEFDLDRAMLAGSIIAMTLGGQEQVRRAATHDLGVGDRPGARRRPGTFLVPGRVVRDGLSGCESLL